MWIHIWQFKFGKIQLIQRYHFGSCASGIGRSGWQGEQQDECMPLIWQINTCDRKMVRSGSEWYNSAKQMPPLDSWEFVDVNSYITIHIWSNITIKTMFISRTCKKTCKVDLPVACCNGTRERVLFWRIRRSNRGHPLRFPYTSALLNVSIVINVLFMICPACPVCPTCPGHHHVTCH